MTLEKLSLGNCYRTSTTLTRAPVLSADIKAENIDIVSADARMNIEQQLFYGVDVVQGVSRYNFNPSSESSINAGTKRH